MWVCGGLSGGFHLSRPRTMPSEEGCVCVCVCVCVCLSSVSESQQLQELFMMKPSLEDVLCSVMHTENDCESLLPEKT